MTLKWLQAVILAALGTFGAAAQTAGTADVQPSGQAAPVEDPTYQPMTGKERFDWFVKGTVGPESLAMGVVTAGIGTARDTPPEYGSHWEGFGERYGIRLSAVGTEKAMEASLGAMWGEDPRYFRVPGEPFNSRMKHILAMTFMARRPDGDLMPAYARYMAVPGSSFLSNTWRVDSDANTHDAAMRTMWGFASVIGSNAFKEFWPDIKTHLFHRKK